MPTTATPGRIEDRRIRRVLAVLGSVVFLLIAPGTVAGLVPWWISRWRVHAPLLDLPLLRLVGALLIIAALPVLLDSFARFALQGLGTPAPVFSTRHLVVSGLYRRVRNPMYIGVVGAIVGQGLFFSDIRLLEYCVFVWMGFHFFVLMYEEPKLRETFGADYEAYCTNVRRWLPRLHPWRGNAT